MGIYAGRSPAHASSVGLILNPRTGHASPQFHVVYDDLFTTVPHLRTGKVPPHWSKLVQESSHFDRVDNQTDTWQSLQLGEADSGDFTGDREDAQPPHVDNAESTVVNQETTHLSEEFVQSEVDPCVFLGDGCIVLTYVDVRFLG